MPATNAVVTAAPYTANTSAPVPTAVQVVLVHVAQGACLFQRYHPVPQVIIEGNFIRATNSFLVVFVNVNGSYTALYLFYPLAVAIVDETGYQGTRKIARGCLIKYLQLKRNGKGTHQPSHY